MTTDNQSQIHQYILVSQGLTLQTPPSQSQSHLSKDYDRQLMSWANVWGAPPGQCGYNVVALPLDITGTMQHSGSAPRRYRYNVVALSRNIGGQ